MPGCKECFEAYMAGERGGVAKATWVVEGTTNEQAESGLGLFCDEHRPEGPVVPIEAWIEGERSRAR